MKKIGIIVGAIVFCLLVAALIAPSFVDWNAYKGQITTLAEDATGRDVSLSGDLSFRLLPSPALTVEGLSLSNIEGASSETMVRLKALDVRVRFLPLLAGTVEVERIVLEEPDLVLEILPDGTTNWDFGGEEADLNSIDSSALRPFARPFRSSKWANHVY